jgi:hypothetical protein
LANSLLFVRLLKEQNFSYGIPSDISLGYSNTFDLDNFSGQEVVDMAIQFLNSHKPQVIIQSEEGAPIQKIMHLFNLIRESKEVNLEWKGNHSMKNYLSSF